MSKTASFTSKFLEDGHLSIPEEIITALSLKKGEKVRAMIEIEKFDKEGFLNLFGIWKDKKEDEIKIYLEILKERRNFGRGEIKL